MVKRKKKYILKVNKNKANKQKRVTIPQEVKTEYVEVREHE